MPKPSRQSYARSKQKEYDSKNYTVTDMDSGSKEKNAQRSYEAYKNAARDYDASTQFDGILNQSSKPIEGAGMRALGQGMLLKTKQPVYDSKGKKVKGLR